MATTVSSLITRITADLNGTRRQKRDVLNGTITSSGTTVVVTHNVAQVHNGDYIEIDDEVMYMMSKSGNNLTVMRGELGSTAAAHTSGATIYPGVAHPRHLIFEDMKAEIDEWPETLYWVNELTVSIGASNPRVVLPADPEDFIRLLKVRAGPMSAQDIRTSLKPDVLRTFDENDQVSLELQNLQSLGRSTDLTVQYASKIVAPTATTDDLEDLMPKQMFTALRYGVMSRRLMDLEARRADNYATGESARPEEIPPGYGVQTASTYRAMADIHVAREERRLQRLFPISERL